ncbi:MAG: pgk, phosphoglycerate kinase, phosphoglycerate kinase [Candidatus Taylorbacteria bacterium]|nr:pgk, phosphoglycerate kinase, phosphoglycerate kinase [Candidatus Taylorbacteria bacterium]
MKFLREIKPADLKGVKALIRLDFNVPVAKGRVVDDFRIRMAIPTINLLKSAGARTIIIAHIETIEADGGPTLAPVADRLKMLGIACTFVKNYRNAQAEIAAMPEGGVILLENLRMNEGEKKNDRAFAKELASLGDIYINDAFSVSHREHASVSAVTEFIPSYCGPLLEQEIVNLSSAFHPDQATGRPFLFILGGAKFDTKLPLIEKFMNLADTVFVGGALANDFFKEKGYEVGKSVVSSQDFNLSRFTQGALAPKLMLPSDVIVGPVAAAQGALDLAKATVKQVDAVSPDDVIYDVGPETLRALGEKIAQAKYVLWNGPIGFYERGFKQPTLALAQKIAEATSRGTKTIVGGGDTLATIAELGIESKFTFISTGGGAMLDFLANETLPGIKALER